VRHAENQCWKAFAIQLAVTPPSNRSGMLRTSACGVGRETRANRSVSLIRSTTASSMARGDVIEAWSTTVEEGTADTRDEPLLPVAQVQEWLAPVVGVHVQPEVRGETREIGGRHRRVHRAVRGAFALVHLQLEGPLPAVAEHLEEDAQHLSGRGLRLG
jgi:hypothetical protein